MQRTHLQSSSQRMQSELADDLLLQRALANDQRAFEILVQRYQQGLYHFSRKCLGSELAQDVTQFVLLQLYLTMPKLAANLASRASLKTWLYRVARNRCVDELRRMRLQPYFFSQAEQEEEGEFFYRLSSLPDPMPLPEEHVEAMEVRDQLCDAIQTLPPTFRAVVWLRYTEGLTFTDIANRLHLLPATTKTYFYRACGRLRAVVSSEAEYV